MVVKRTLLACALACLTTNTAIAATKPLNAAKVERDMQRLMTRTQQLQHEVVALRKEVSQLKQKRRTRPRINPVRPIVRHHSKSSAANRQYAQREQRIVDDLKQQEHPDEIQYKDFGNRPLTYLGGTPVITSPYIGVRSAFDGSDLIVNISSINEDLRLLEQRKKLERAIQDAGFAGPEYPVIELSGKAEAQAFAQHPYVGSTTGDVDLSGAEFDIFAAAGPWASGFLSMTYDNSTPGTGGQRTSNSRNFLNKAFLTIGNLNRLPVYFTAGQFFVPFGRYSTNMLSSSLPQAIGRTKARAVQLGYKQPGPDGLYAAVYGFNGDSGASATGVGGVNLGYEFAHPHSWHGDVSGSVISNVADADGMQGTGGAGFFGFGATRASERIMHKIPAVDGHVRLGYGPVDVIAEYVFTTRRFNPMDLTFGTAGAKPSAWQLEASYRTELFARQTSFAIGYGETTQALALNLPQKRFLAAINTSIWRNTIQSLEYRHDINYPGGTIAAGRGLTGVLTPVVTGGALGHTADTVTAQIGVYF